jgi:DNA-binding helix-hairpin-helix protein with protein kinase domain
MARPHLFHTFGGREIVLGRELGRGGEGNVYEVQGVLELAAKIYHQNKAGDRAEKISAMTSAKWHTLAPNIAFPIDALYEHGNRFVGFTMRRVGGQQPIHALYSPTSRKSSFPEAGFKFLIRTALNIARSIANVHNTGCVIGDINHSGILVANNATATLIDCDSFQVQAAGKTFLCKVGVSEFTPPELQNKRLDQLCRTVNHDGFGLAIIIFNLLFMGRHPFAGKFLGRGEMLIEQAIAQYRFAYSSRKSETRMEPPPGVPLLDDMPKEIADAFEMAFGPVGTTIGRPGAADWVRLIEGAERQIVTCESNAAHHHFRVSTSCPWCRMEATYPGFLAFAPQVTSIATPSSLSKLIEAIRSVPDPGEAPNLIALMPPFQGSPSPAALSSRDAWMGRYVAGIAGVLVAFELMHLQQPGPLIGFALFFGAAFLAFGHTRSTSSIRQSVDQAKGAWEAVERQWRQRGDNQEFRVLRREGMNWFKEYKGWEARKQEGFLISRLSSVTAN